jgi:hypothetical protein
MPSPVSSHQTIRLSRGHHRGPEHGACVMELASMLAGERFSDRPQCASPVIAGFLRTYNDAVGDDRRQDLYRYAALVVDSRGSADVEFARAARCTAWGRARATDAGHGLWRRRRLAKAAHLPAQPTPEDCGSMAARVAAGALRRGDDTAHAAALAFVDELLAIRSAPSRSLRSGVGPARSRAAARG